MKKRCSRRKSSAL